MTLNRPAVYHFEGVAPSMVPPPARLNFGNWKNKSARLLRRLLAVEIGSTTDSTQQSNRVCLVARRMRYGSYVCVSQHGNTVCGMPFRPELIAGPSSDARHARVSDCGPKSPEKFSGVECAPVVRTLGETLPNVESRMRSTRHAREEGAVELFLLWRHSAICTSTHGSRWRTRGPQRGSLKQVPRLRARTGHAPLQAGSSFRTLPPISSHSCEPLSLGQTRGCRISYVFSPPEDQAYQARTR